MELSEPILTQTINLSVPPQLTTNLPHFMPPTLTQIIYTSSGIPIKPGHPWNSHHHHHHQDHQQYQYHPTANPSLSSRFKSRLTTSSNRNSRRATEVTSLNPRPTPGNMVGIQGVYNTLGSTHNSFVFTPPIKEADFDEEEEEEERRRESERLERTLRDGGEVGSPPVSPARGQRAAGDQHADPADDFYNYDRERQLVLKPRVDRKVSHDGGYYYHHRGHGAAEDQPVYSCSDNPAPASSTAEVNWILLPAATWSQSGSIAVVRGVGVQTSPLLLSLIHI